MSERERGGGREKKRRLHSHNLITFWYICVPSSCPPFPVTTPLLCARYRETKRERVRVRESERERKSARQREKEGERRTRKQKAKERAGERMKDRGIHTF